MSKTSGGHCLTQRLLIRFITSMKKRITLSGLSELRKWLLHGWGLSGSVEKGKLMEIYCPLFLQSEMPFSPPNIIACLHLFSCIATCQQWSK
jgi:hypothetical protein